MSDAMPDKLAPFKDQSLRNRSFTILGISLLAFTLWVGLAPVESAVLAKGHIRAMEDSKPIQHLRGGKIASIEARSGEQVSKGNILLQLDVAEEQSALKANLRDYLMTLLEMEIAQTHINQSEELRFSQKVLLLAKRLQDTQILSMRQQSFAKTIDRKKDQLTLLDSREQQLHLSIEAQKIENRARLERLELVNKQHTAVVALAGKNYVSEIWTCIRQLFEKTNQKR